MRSVKFVQTENVGEMGPKVLCRVMAWIRSLGTGRVTVVAFFFLIYCFLVAWSWIGDMDPHEKFHYQRQEAKKSGGMIGELMVQPERKLSIPGYAPPNYKHWLGTDEHGRDVFTRLAHGAHTSLVTGCICVLAFLLAGTGFGIVAGYFEGRWRTLVMYLFNLVNTFPILLFLLLSVIIIDGVVESLSLRIDFLMFFLGLFSSPKLAELIRGKISSLKEMAFIQAAISLGLSPVQIIFKHILWYGCRPLIVAQAAYMMGQAILIETTLTYLSFGLEYPLVSWGLMLRTYSNVINWSMVNIDGNQVSTPLMEVIRTAQGQALTVMAMIALSVFFFQYLATLLNDLLEPRERNF